MAMKNILGYPEHEKQYHILTQNMENGQIGTIKGSKIIMCLKDNNKIVGFLLLSGKEIKDTYLINKDLSVVVTLLPENKKIIIKFYNDFDTDFYSKYNGDHPDDEE